MPILINNIYLKVHPNVRSHLDRLDESIKSKTYFANEIDKDNGCTTLHYAAMVGWDFGIEWLLKAGVDVNVEDDAGRTPLNMATSLLEHPGIANSDINALYYNFHAHSDKYIEIIKLLISYGARINLANSTLHYALRNSATKEVIELLLSLGLDVNFIDHDKTTPLYWSVWHGEYEGRQEIIELLLNNGAELNINNGAKVNEEMIELVKKHEKNKIKKNMV